MIAKSKSQNIKKFICGKRDFETAYESAADQGHASQCYKKLHAFRNYISDLDTEKTLWDLDKGVQDKCVFELNKIHKKTEKLHKKLSG